jgi:hypothetical protein
LLCFLKLGCRQYLDRIGGWPRYFEAVFRSALASPASSAAASSTTPAAPFKIGLLVTLILIAVRSTNLANDLGLLLRCVFEGLFPRRGRVRGGFLFMPASAASAPAVAAALLLALLLGVRGPRSLVDFVVLVVVL